MYLGDKYPFGEAFGSVASRDECIVASHDTYYRLLGLTPDAPQLSFDVLASLAVDDKGEEDSAKLMAIRRLFRPDVNNNVSLLAFVQSCDWVYKRLRYFSASLGNASVIDLLLGDMKNKVFYFLLLLLLLLLQDFNPWSFLLSITSILVSVSFALGPTISKYVEVKHPC